MVFGRRTKKLEDKTKEGFDSVKKDFERVGAWIKHLDQRDKRLFDFLNGLKIELASVREDIDGLREGLSLVDFETKTNSCWKNRRFYENKQLLVVFKSLFKQLFKQAILRYFE